jgi:uroporphyrinogen decarboxylase
MSHQRPDRPPRDFRAEKPAWNRLFDHLGHRDEERLLRRLGIDLRHINAIEPPEREPEPGVFQNFWGERYVYDNTPWGPMRQDLDGALGDAGELSQIRDFAWPSVDDLDHRLLSDLCRKFERYALVYGSGDIWQRAALVRGWEGMFLDMAERPEWVDSITGVFTDFYIEDYTRAAEATNGRIDLFLIYSDLGSQHGPLISPKMFRRFIAPNLGRICRTIHSLGAKVLFHSCGDVRVFIDDLIDLGVDMLDPIQPVSEGMSPEALAQAYRGRITFHGGIDMQGLLPHGTESEIRAEAQRYSEVLGREGGYILGPTHFFQPDVPPRNVLAVYE